MKNGKMNLICRILAVSIVVILSSGMAEAVIDITDSYDFNFAYAGFGQYKAVDFFGLRYFAGYDSSYVSPDITNSAINILQNGNISNILIDSNTKYTVATGGGIWLKDGYALHVNQVDINGNQAMIELRKNGKNVDTGIVRVGAVYRYEKDIWLEDDVPLIIVHVFSINDGNSIDFDGVFQISDTLTSVNSSVVEVNNPEGALTLIPPPTGSIYVSSSPSGANVYLDGVYKGTTPHTITSVSARSHTIKLTKTGYADITKTVNIANGATATVTETLVPISPSVGSISISSNPSGANVYLDDAYQGTTPYTITSVSAGSHTIKLTKTGYIDATRIADVFSEGTTVITQSLTSISSPTGSIFITSDLADAKVYLDDGYIGIAPITIDEISIGMHSIKLAKEGYTRKIESVIVTKDNTEKISISFENTALESSGSVGTRAPNVIDKDSDSSIKSDQKTSDTNLYSRVGAIILLLFLMGIVASSRKKSKAKRQSINAHSGDSTTSTKSVSHSQDKVTESTSTKSNTTPIITSAFGYKGAIIQYKIKVENPTSEPIADIKINLYVPDVFLVSESTKSIAMLKPSESKTVTFEIRPTGECGDCEVSGKVIYYDYSTKKTTGIDIPPKSLSIVCPMLKMKEISEPEWHSIVSNLIETEESTGEIDMPAETLFIMTSRIVKDMHMHRLEPEITNSQQLFNGVARFYGEGVKGLKYAAQVEVVGGAKKSRLILKTWAEKEEALTGFYHGLLDEIEKRVHVKGYIDDSIVQNFYHYGDKIGTQVKDSIVQRSNIGAGGDVDAGAGADTGEGGNVAERKCPTCGTVAEGNGKFCNECGGKL